MRTVVFLVILSSLIGCQTMSERTCANEGFEPGSPEFSACVRELRREGSVRMKEQAGQGLNSGGLNGH